jgi:hypothetical protein
MIHGYLFYLEVNTGEGKKLKIKLPVAGVSGCNGIDVAVSGCSQTADKRKQGSEKKGAVPGNPVQPPTNSNKLNFSPF